MAGLHSLILMVFATFLTQAACLPPTAPTSAGPSLSVYSARAVPTPTVGTGCLTEAGDARMDSFTVKRLSTLFCNKMLAHPPTFTYDNFTLAEYPTDLAPLPNSANYTALEQEGYIAVFDLTISSSYIDSNGTIHKQGQRSQCAMDNCLQIFNAIIDRCESSTHYVGGYMQHITDCGSYSVYTMNCTDDIIEQDCSRWHSKWQPSYTTTSSTTTYSARTFTNTDFYAFTFTEPTTTITSQVMVSTVTGANWTSITPVMFTIDHTYTGYTPNPTLEGPTFSPRFSTVSSTPSSIPKLTTSKMTA